MTTHVEAKRTLEQAVPGIDPGTSLLVRAVSCIEAHYGDWWKGGPGEGSNNWGSITAGSGWSGPTFEHKDSYFDKKTGKNVPYVTDFRSYPTQAAAAKDLYSVLVNGYPAAVELAQNGNWTMVSEALYGYYRGTATKAKAIAAHRKRLLECIAEITAATGESVDGLSTGKVPSGQGHPLIGKVLFLGTLAALPVYLALRKAHRNG